MRGRKAGHTMKKMTREENEKTENTTKGGHEGTGEGEQTVRGVRQGKSRSRDIKEIQNKQIP